MCFSPAASFLTAGITGVVGLVTLARVSTPRELPLGVMPLVFALQQLVEGLLWLNLPMSPQGPTSTALTYLFLFFAQVFWPVFSPIAVVLTEPDGKRRRLMLMLLTVGAAVSCYFLWSLVTHPHSAFIVDDHIVYRSEIRPPDPAVAAYLAATCFPLLLSRRRTILTLGAVILVGAAVAYVFYWESFESVWCFFAAVASLAILGHFEWARQARRLLSGH